MRQNSMPTLRSGWRVLLLAIALGFGLPAPYVAADAASPAAGAVVAAQDALAGSALLAALRKGGYVLYLRHASTDFGQNDEAMTSFDDCSSQRNLTDQGRAEARAIGVAVTALHIPADPVLASPFCRTLETARLVFGDARATTDVRGGPPGRPGSLRAAAQTLVHASAARSQSRHRESRQPLRGRCRYSLSCGG